MTLSEDIEDVLAETLNAFYDYITEKDIIKVADEYSNKTIPKKATKAINKLILEFIKDLCGGEIDNYKPYLVVRHKLGLEANQTQAKLIATCVNQYRKELLELAEKRLGEK